jgi:hypothetical protein
MSLVPEAWFWSTPGGLAQTLNICMAVAGARISPMRKLVHTAGDFLGECFVDAAHRHQGEAPRQKWFKGKGSAIDGRSEH